MMNCLTARLASVREPPILISRVIWPLADRPLVGSFGPILDSRRKYQRFQLSPPHCAATTAVRARTLSQPNSLARRPGVCQRSTSPREQRLEVNMVNNRTPAQTRWGLGNPDDELENPNSACPGCTGTGRSRSGQQCSDCLGAGAASSQSPK